MRARLARWLGAPLCLAGAVLGGAVAVGPAAAAGPDEPGVLVVQTVPVVPGARVSADGTMARADDDGVARLPVRTFVDLGQRFNAPQTKVADDRRVELDRVRGQLDRAYSGKVIEVGLRTERRVKWTFTDRMGTPIHPDELSTLVLRSSTGERLTLTGDDLAGPRWLAASRTQQTSNGLMSKDIYWTVQSVLMDRAELVNRSQQRFVPDASTEWQIRLLFYRVEVRSSDLLFGSPVGEGVEITGPDGVTTRQPLDADGLVTLPAVARGEYRMEVYGDGVSFTRPVSVSRDQQVHLLVISTADIALVATTLVLIAVSLILVGRRRRIATWSAGLRSPRDPGGEDSSPVGAGSAALCMSLVAGLLLAALPAPAARAIQAEHPPVAAGSSTGSGTRDTPRGARTAHSNSPVPVLAYYYIWFTPTSWRRAKIDYPLLGRYSSDDEVVMAEHVRLAQESGIDGFLVSWKRTPQLNKRLEELSAVAQASGFRLGIVYQGLDFAREPLPADRIQADLEWFAKTYARNSTFHTIDEQPVVVWTGTERFSDEDIARVTASVEDRLHVLASAKSVEDYLRVADLVDGNAYYWSSVNPSMQGYAEKLEAMGSAVHSEGGLWIAPFAPGFDARLVGGSSVVPREGGKTLRTELRAAQASNPDALGLISWNEFSENTHIEPSEEHGSTALRALALSLGATPPQAPADSSDEAVENHAGVTGWGALVLILASLALLNLFVLWRTRPRAKPVSPPTTA